MVKVLIAAVAALAAAGVQAFCPVRPSQAHATRVLKAAPEDELTFASIVQEFKADIGKDFQSLEANLKAEYQQGLNSFENNLIAAIDASEQREIANVTAAITTATAELTQAIEELESDMDRFQFNRAAKLVLFGLYITVLAHRGVSCL